MQSRVRIIGHMDGALGWCMPGVIFKSGQLTSDIGLQTSIQDKRIVAELMAYFSALVLTIAGELEKEPLDASFMLTEEKAVHPLLANFDKGGKKPALDPVALSNLLKQPVLAENRVNPWTSKARMDAFQNRMQAEWPREGLGKALLELNRPASAFSAVTMNSMFYGFYPEGQDSVHMMIIEEVVPEAVFERLKVRPH